MNNKTQPNRKSQIIFRVPFHPLLFAWLPLIIILAQNSGEIAPTLALRSALISLLLSVCFLALFWFLQRNWKIAAVGASFALLYFHIAGRLLKGNVLPPLAWLVELLGQRAMLLAFSLLIIILLLGIVRNERLISPITVLLNVVGFSLAVTFSLQVVANEWKIQRPFSPPPLNGATLVSEARPDIYYVVLDGYARADVLTDLFSSENFTLLDFLSTNGFLVQENARANYMQTSLSLASSLNLDYLQDLLSPERLAGDSRLELMNLIRHNRLQSLLENAGYKIIRIDSGYRPTELLMADQVLSTSDPAANLFERLIIENSALTALESLPNSPPWITHPGYQLHRARVDYGFDQLSHLAEQEPGGRFIFLHVLIPHPPFVFNQFGEPIQPAYPYVLLDGDAFPGNPTQYLQQYESQRLYLDQRLTEVLADILENNGHEAIIVLQSDHGPGSQLNWGSAYQTSLRERFGILLAYRLPKNQQDRPVSFYSPVNLFRSILNNSFGTELPYLAERSYFSTWVKPLNFELINRAEIDVIR